MSSRILRETIEDGMKIIEYTKDGETVSGRISYPSSIVEINPEPSSTVETTEQKIERLEQQVQSDNLIMMEVLATIYEELLASKGSV